MVAAMRLAVSMALVCLSLGLSSQAALAKDTKGTAPSRKRTIKRIRRPVQNMDNKRLDTLIRAMSKKVVGRTGGWTFHVDGVEVSVITDEKADRMRIVAAIASAKSLDRKELLVLLEANFDRALDAKYTVFNDVVWATFVHPLSPLTREEFISAAKQVAALHTTYGTSFSSMSIVFGGGAAAGAKKSK